MDALSIVLAMHHQTIAEDSGRKGQSILASTSAHPVTSCSPAQLYHHPPPGSSRFTSGCQLTIRTAPF